jgi:hypothetical protein
VEEAVTGTEELADGELHRVGDGHTGRVRSRSRNRLGSVEKSRWNPQNLAPEAERCTP